MPLALDTTPSARRWPLIIAGDEEKRRSALPRATPRSGRHPVVSSDPSVPRVIIAEDDEGFRTVLTTFFRSEGFVVTEAYDGQELVQALDATPPGFFDLVIADHRMPIVSGLEVLARAGARAPFVIVSGVDDQALRDSADKFGAAAVVSKPVDLHKLLALVRGLLLSREG